METFRADQFKALGLPHDFVQENHSPSKKDVLRGLHFQWDPPMGKLMQVTSVATFLVAVDKRPGSPTVGQWFGIEASAINNKTSTISDKDRNAKSLTEWMALPDARHFAYTEQAIIAKRSTQNN